MTSPSRERKVRRSSVDLSSRFAAFVAERFPLVVDPLLEAWAAATEKDGTPQPDQPQVILAFRRSLRTQIKKRLRRIPKQKIGETTPGVRARVRMNKGLDDLIEECLGLLEREAIQASLTENERREILRGMLLTRATDNRLKTFFTGGEVRHGSRSFQGKGFRSLGQEAIYAATIRLRRGDSFRGPGGAWNGDIVAPLIRDLGAALGMSPEPETIRMVLNAQMGKSGKPMEGKDLHVGEYASGILPATAPLSISSLTVAGLAMAFHLERSDRVAVSFIGEGGSSLGEWHEAINLCAARKLPAIFCLQNNQTALSTPVSDQSAVRVFADKAVGYGVPGVTVDGTDPDAIAAAFAWAAERARAGEGPTLIELIAMRMCGHAHHDDMLYLGQDPTPGWEYPVLIGGGYVDPEAYGFWALRDPIKTYASRLIGDGEITAEEFEQWKQEVEELVAAQARAVIDAPWPDPALAGTGVCAGESPRLYIEPLDNRAVTESLPPIPPLDPGPIHDPNGQTFLEAIMLGIGDAMRADERVFVYGQDVGGQYGNAFLLLRPLLDEFGERVLNSTLAEGGILGVCVGAALAGRRPIGEIQFNDFVASGFNQLVNNAAKIRYRWGGSVPMVVRMPWGGLRSAGPYHSQNTEAWFYRTPGLKIVVPSTPHDARALLASAVNDPDPVLYYEHIALYRDPKIKQQLGRTPPEPIELGRAALRRGGSDLTIVSYGAYVHLALRVAERLSEDGIESSVLDLRTLAPLDRQTLLAVAKKTSRVLIIHEDTRTGSIGESLAAVIQEEAFEFLDAPVRIVGALDTPVPYSPTLEEAFLPGEERVERAARLLTAY